MAISATPPTASPSSTQQTSHYRGALYALTSLFFMWGFITCLNDILIPYLKNAFALSYTQAMLIQFCFFGAYFLVSIPAGQLVARIGFQKGIVTGLGIAAVGCALFYPAAESGIYGVFLFALFVLASGITILQVSANPYVTVLGPAETAPSRLTMTQAFNSLGTTVAPIFGAMLIFSGEEHTVVDGAHAVQMPYLLLAAITLALAAIFVFLKLPKIETHSQKIDEHGSLLKHRHLVLGAVGIFVYVGAEVAIGSFLVSYLAKPEIAGLTEAQASTYIAIYWGGAMVGRFIGAVVMQKISGAKVLAFNAVAAIVLIAISVSSTGSIAMWTILAVGLCNSVMFPTIFSLALKDLGEQTAKGSGLLCLAIVGGAIVPLIQGVLADNIGVQLAFVLPIVCYLFIAYYGVNGHKVIAEAQEGNA